MISFLFTTKHHLNGGNIIKGASERLLEWKVGEYKGKLTGKQGIELIEELKKG